MGIFKNKKHWQDMTQDALNVYAKEIFDHYRTHGFPYYSTEYVDRKKEFDKLMRFDCKDIIVDKNIRQTMHGLSLAWSYMPHSFSIPCNGFKTPTEIFDNDDLFLKAIHKRLRLGDNISDAGIRKALKIYSGAQSVSNFRPTAACAIYDQFAGDGMVLDMSAGYGGRMLGAIKSNRVKQYIGLDPCSLTFDGLNKMRKDFDKDIKCHVFALGSEEFCLFESFDLCFTSPPYFDTEKYSNESTQSYVKFPKLECWYKHFLQKTIHNCFKSLKANGYLILNIKDSKKMPDFTERALAYAKNIGFSFVDEYKLSLSNLATFTNNKDTYTYEPVLIWKKV